VTTSENLPAPRDPADTALAEADAERHDAPLARPPRQNMSVAYLPLALISFVILALIAAAWTFLATAV
jgi:hypothetical protein